MIDFPASPTTGQIFSAAGASWRYDGTKWVAYSDAGTAWTAYTPTVTANSGTFTTVSGAGRYKLLGKTCFISVTVVITTNGTAAGGVIVTLPAGVAPAGGGVGVTLMGRETSIGGWTLAATVGATNFQIVKYDNTYPGGSGAGLTVSGVMEIA